jgi:site-specific DNA recombinase
VTTAALPRLIRVAAYCRKSHAQGLEQEFNSIDAQRQAIESFIASQRGAGWIALPERYDDGGYSGASVDRPSFQRLLADVAAGKIDCIAVYRIDRLSRSFADYVGILKLFEQHGATFVSPSSSTRRRPPAGSC